MEEERLTALIQESLAVATRTGAAKPADFSKVIVDTTVQPKAAPFRPTRSLMHQAVAFRSIGEGEGLYQDSLIRTGGPIRAFRWT